ncbi:rhodanese-like domain-containing protein [Brevibacillus fluminis]|uniref:Rhodanese-like domain-containing protein n=1 Tax=Brevibacillus fluminis TaxID=511487 RepID=A0A3M8DJ51_9BACL|nr:rhodanese-like domain-containing protein [Brevibacillus fluminis]RNB87405.1 rhodanese-like domain-containing protein [Brevibacillus fluminis]
MTKKSNFSLVLETPAASPEEARRHFLAKLSVETDVADVALDLRRGNDSFILVDVRSQEAYADCHIPGAINLPARQINSDTTAALPSDKLIVTYCWGPACNSSTKAAARFASLGFPVKELIGGIEYWRREGGAVEGRLCEKAPLHWNMND